MPLDNLTPEVWADRLERRLEKALVFGQPLVVNTDYEGEIKAFGDEVNINFIGPVTIGDYGKNTDMNTPQVLTDSQTKLKIDQAKYFNFYVDKIDAVQNKPDAMTGGMAEAAYGIRDVIDQSIASLYTDVATANAIGSDGTPIVLTAVTDAYNYLVQLGIKLDEANVPTEGRYAIVPPWYYGLMLQDQRFVQNATEAGVEILRNAQVGEAAGFAIMRSNNCVKTNGGTTYKVQAGISKAMSYAGQIVDIQTFQPERRFGTAVKGLYVYGRKVIRPDAFAVLSVNRYP